MPIHLAIAEDHQLMISSIKNTVQATGYIVVSGTFTNAEKLLESLPLLQPDILLLDYHLPDQNGAKVARYISYHYPNIRMIALTGFDKPGLCLEMLESGCMGYLLKASVDETTLLEAIHAVNEGKMYLDSMVRNEYLNGIRRKQHEEKPEVRLTNRELEVLKGIAEELSNKEIAEKFGISKRTVDNHRTSIMMKTGSKNTVSLIKFAIEIQLI
jgi:DNA-binding NarL/FixJ family response regulator